MKPACASPVPAFVFLLVVAICHLPLGHGFKQTFSHLSAEEPEVSCIPSEFLCVDKSACVQRHLVCDGHANCDDRSDELPDCKPLGCGSGEFSCRSDRKCIPARWKCDGSNDCDDKSDELHCESGTCSLERGLFLCKDGVTCESSINVCDGVSNCPSRDDEGGQCNVTCSSITCSHGCFKTPYGPQCTCPSGYHLSSSGLRCVEIDECQRWPPVCSQKCANTNGSFVCSCVPGYTLLSDTHCIATRPEPVLFYSEPGRIVSVGLKQHRVREIIVDVPYAVNIALDGADDRIFWTDPRHGVVKSVGFNGLDRSDVIAKGLKHPEAVAFDWLGRLVYVVDSGLQKIMACAPDGSVCTDVIEVSHAHDLVLDPLAAIMYWSEWTGSDSAAILCAGMDGHDRRSQLSSGLHRPSSLTLDQPTSTLFWTDVFTNTVEMLNLNTGMHRILLEHEAGQPMSLAMFEDHIFWYEHTDSSIYRADKWTGKGMRQLARRLPLVGHLTVYHPSQHIRDQHVNPCWEKPCSHLCLLGEHGSFRCACPGGARLINNYTCAENREEPYLLVTRRTEIVKVHPSKIGRQHTAEKLEISDLHYVTCIDYDWHNNVLFFNDFTKDVIRRARLNDTAQITTIIDRDLMAVEGLAVDWLSKNLYWADSGKGTVEVSRYDGSSRAVLLHKDHLHLENPRSVAIDPINGYLFVSDWGNRGRIERCSLNGRNCTTIVANLGWPNDITIDFREAKIIWTDAKHRRIEMATEDGAYSSVVIRHVVQHPHAVAIVGNFVYWTDWDTASVHYANKRDGVRRDLLTAMDGVMDLVAVGPRLRPTPIASSGCMLNNGGCSDLCFPVHSTSGRLEHTCGCPDGKSLTTPTGKSCQENVRQCGLHEVTCGSRCIPLAQVCNGHVDCPDGSDEAPGLCPALLECGVLDFACGDGKCINIDYRCDGDLDCVNGTDELNCEHITCAEGRFLCDETHCFSAEARCDGTSQCVDGSDEMNCTAAAGCTAEEHQCPDGKCIHSSWLCDGEHDCLDGDDEKNCGATSFVTHCKPNEWRCESGQCIRRQQLCDDFVHCDDGSDETPTECTQSWNCDERTQFHCYHSVDHSCIPRSFVCDEVPHCDMGEDEYNCTTRGACDHGDFQCTTDGHCVGSRWVCDGSQDCSDGSDEDPGMCWHQAASSTTSPVPHTRTTPATTATTTHQSEPRCSAYEFLCGSGECIRESQLCDSFLDCLDGSDEDGRCNVHCQSDNGGCSHHCHSSPYGPVCLCPAGFRLNDDRKTCIDVDECHEHADSCSQMCENHEGSFSCKCVAGYRLTSNLRSCAAEGARADIIIAMGSEVRKAKIGHHDYQSVVYGPDKQIVAVDFDAKSGNIYWSEVEKGSIQKYDAGQRRITTLFSDMKNCEGLALDWITHNIYLTDALHKVVWVCSGDMCGHVVHDHLDRPRAIALHAAEGIMFWSDWGHHAKIESAWMNGQHRKVIVGSNLGWPNGISIDFVRNHLYWVDAKLNTIERVDFLGRGRTLISDSAVRHPYSVAVFEDFVYWSDILDRAVMRRSKMAPNNISAVHTEQSAPLDIKIMHAVQQPKGVNYCTQENAPKCSHLCLLVPNGASCLCPIHTETSATDSALCIESVVERRTLGPNFDDGEPHGISCDECDNGATCLFDRRGNIVCSCAEGFTGRRCESMEETSPPRQLLATTNNAWVAALVICLIILLVLLSIAICYIRLRYRRAKAHTGIVTFRDILSKGKEGKDSHRESLLNSSSFENPVYKDPMAPPEKPSKRQHSEYETIPAEPNVYTNYMECKDQLDSYTMVSDKQALKTDF